jgi:hypothetical protein
MHTPKHPEALTHWKAGHSTAQHTKARQSMIQGHATGRQDTECHKWCGQGSNVRCATAYHVTLGGYNQLTCTAIHHHYLCFGLHLMHKTLVYPSAQDPYCLPLTSPSHIPPPPHPLHVTHTLTSCSADASSSLHTATAPPRVAITCPLGLSEPPRHPPAHQGGSNAPRVRAVREDISRRRSSSTEGPSTATGPEGVGSTDACTQNQWEESMGRVRQEGGGGEGECRARQRGGVDGLTQVMQWCSST